MSFLNNKPDIIFDPRLEYNSDIQKLGITPDLYRKYSIAMDQNCYDDALRLARQIDAEIYAKYQQSISINFFRKEPKFKFTPVTALYAAEERLKNRDYIGAINLYNECLEYTYLPFTDKNYLTVDVYFQNDKMWTFIHKQIDEIVFVLKAQIDYHFKSLEQLRLNSTPSNINKMKRILLKIAEILSVIPEENSTKDYFMQYNAWQDKVTAIIRAQALDGNFNEIDIDDMLDKPNSLVFSQNAKSNTNLDLQELYESAGLSRESISSPAP